MYKGVCVFVGGGVALLIFSFFLNINLRYETTETKLFHFHRIFKNRGRGGGSLEPSLDPPLDCILTSASAVLWERTTFCLVSLL